MFREHTKSSARQALICPINVWSPSFSSFFREGGGGEFTSLSVKMIYRALPLEVLD